MTKDTSGPAFPVPAELCQDLTIEEQRGLTVRDYFAIHASEEDIRHYGFTGRLLEKPNTLTGSPSTIKVPEARTREQARYAFADAMLKARQA